jgi:hypothetical protein
MLNLIHKQAFRLYEGDNDLAQSTGFQTITYGLGNDA